MSIQEKDIIKSDLIGKDLTIYKKQTGELTPIDYIMLRQSVKVQMHW